MALPEITAEMSGRNVCKALKFRGRDLGFDLKFSSHRGFRPIETRDGNPFEAGIISLPGGRSAGLLRIAHFGEDGYPGICRAAWEEYRNTMDGACTDGWCAGFRTLIRDRLLAYIEDRIRAMDAAGYDLLVADITGNGGGTDWVNAAARIVSPKKLLCNRVSMVRHSHWQSILEEKQQGVRNDLEREGLSPAVRERLALADRNVQTMIDQTRAPCDRMPMCEGREPEGGCTNLVQGENHTCGLFPHLEPGDLEGITWRGVLFTPFQNRYTESVNRKPLVVLMDRGTASAGVEDPGRGLRLRRRKHSPGAGTRRASRDGSRLHPIQKGRDQRDRGNRAGRRAGLGRRLSDGTDREGAGGPDGALHGMSRGLGLPLHIFAVVDRFGAGSTGRRNSGRSTTRLGHSRSSSVRPPAGRWPGSEARAVATAFTGERVARCRRLRRRHIGGPSRPSTALAPPDSCSRAFAPSARARARARVGVLRVRRDPAPPPPPGGGRAPRAPGPVPR